MKLFKLLALFISLFGFCYYPITANAAYRTRTTPLRNLNNIITPISGETSTTYDDDLTSYAFNGKFTIYSYEKGENDEIVIQVMDQRISNYTTEETCWIFFTCGGDRQFSLVSEGNWSIIEGKVRSLGAFDTRAQNIIDNDLFNSSFKEYSESAVLTDSTMNLLRVKTASAFSTGEKAKVIFHVEGERDLGLSLSVPIEGIEVGLSSNLHFGADLTIEKEVCQGCEYWNYEYDWFIRPDGTFTVKVSTFTNSGTSHKVYPNNVSGEAFITDYYVITQPSC